MKKVFVYGLGKEFKEQKYFIENEFDIVGYSDKKELPIENYIEPERITDFDYDFVYVTSSRYFEEIKEELEDKYQISKEKIISKKDILGDFRNAEVRRKWIINKLQQIPEGKILLDAGAGRMQYADYCSHLKYIAQDLGEYNSCTAEGGLHSCLDSWDQWDTSRLNIVCDIIDMPLENETIDVILCSEVFEHLKNPILAIKEFNRILKPGGQLILTAPFCCLTHMAPYFYSNGFSKYWYKENLHDFGFEIKEIVPNGNFFEYLSQELFRVNEMAQRYCNTSLRAEEVTSITDSIRVLSKLSSIDSGSSETLCFGYMLTAVKCV